MSEYVERSFETDTHTHTHQYFKLNGKYVLPVVCLCVLCGIQNKLSRNVYQYIFCMLEIVLQSKVEAKHVFII